METERLLIEAVKEDIRCFITYNSDLNPYSTPSSRASWQRGFDGGERLITGYKVEYDRGKLCKEYIDETLKGKQC